MANVYVYDATSHARDPKQPILKDANGVTLDNSTIDIMVGACNLLLSKFCAAWEVRTPRVYRLLPGVKPKPLDWVFPIIDADPNEPGAVAYHVDRAEMIDGYVLAKTIFGYGGFVLTDKSITGPKVGTELWVHGSNKTTVAGALFHEITEAIIDDSINIWWESYTALNIIHPSGTTKSQTTFKNGTTFVCAEVCDPVQQNYVVVTYRGNQVALSDYVLPAWKNEDLKRPYNYINTLTKAFTIDLGGYAIILDSTGQAQQVFSQAIPVGVEKMKTESQKIRKLRANLA